MVAVVVMGVSGSGKSSVGRRLARRLRADFADADDYHPPANVAKMAAGTPLDDDDRRPWLERLHALIAEHLADGCTLVLACSALKERYRAALAGGDPRVHFVYLAGDYATIEARMRRRRTHYMKAAMLRSQFDALEEPRNAIRLDVRRTLPQVLRGALRGLAERGVPEAAAALRTRTPAAKPAAAPTAAPTAGEEEEEDA